MYMNYIFIYGFKKATNKAVMSFHVFALKGKKLQIH